MYKLRFMFADGSNYTSDGVWEFAKHAKEFAHEKMEGNRNIDCAIMYLDGKPYRMLTPNVKEI